MEIPLDNRVTLSSDRLFLFAGPCVLESADLAHGLAERLRDICSERDIPYVFKASYDKANRTSITSYRGPGLKKGRDLLGAVKERWGVPVLTDVHLPSQTGPIAEVADVLQIPAFLCRQTDLLVAAAETGRAINVKKGQFLAPWDARHIVEKLREAGSEKVCLTERGTTFGFNHLVNDLRGLDIMKETGALVVYDATHSQQLPGGRGKTTGGMRHFIPIMARSAMAAGANGLFMEVHLEPEKALCDRENVLHIDEVPRLLDECLAIRKALDDQAPLLDIQDH